MQTFVTIKKSIPMATILYKWFVLSGFLFTAALPQHNLLRLQQNTIATDGITTPHPFYIAITEINHNAKNKALEISCKMFAEDLEQTLKKNYKTELDLSSAKDKAVLDKLIPDYINRHFSISVDGKPARMNFVGYEEDKEAAYCYFQVDNVPSVKKVDISNSLLYDFNQEQINIIHVVVNGKRQSTKLDYPSSQASFMF